MPEASVKALRDKACEYVHGLGRGEHVFELRASQAVLVVVDMQNFVCRPAPGRELPGLAEVMERLNSLAAGCRLQGIPVVWLRQVFHRQAGGDDAGLYRRFHREPLDPGLFEGGEAAELYAGMQVDPARDYVVAKNRYSALAPGSSRLAQVLAGLGRRQLILGGAATNVCVESTARDAMQRGYEVTVLADATTAFDPLLHEISLLNLKLFFGDVRTAAEVARALFA
ncbi:MAG: cysteine hydrolase [Deltaproteobacteria bacterium]|nr:cysteine hydrolase [Deltaproteobacteria bacterium]